MVRGSHYFHKPVPFPTNENRMGILIHTQINPQPHEPIPYDPAGRWLRSADGGGRGGAGWGGVGRVGTVTGGSIIMHLTGK